MGHARRAPSLSRWRGLGIVAAVPLTTGIAALVAGRLVVGSHAAAREGGAPD